MQNAQTQWMIPKTFVIAKSYPDWITNQQILYRRNVIQCGGTLKMMDDCTIPIGNGFVFDFKRKNAPKCA